MRRIVPGTLATAIAALLIASAPAALASLRVIYVDDDATGLNDGSSWKNAYVCLQDALTIATAGDEVRVAQGIYRPDVMTVLGRSGPEVVVSGDRDATFQLRIGVAIRGGYGGLSEPDPHVRDIQQYETILSGDLEGNDGHAPATQPGLDPSRLDNARHVVTGSATDRSAVIDGFTITAGYNINGEGAGMLNDSGSPTVMNCTFRDNRALQNGGGSRGGGMHNGPGSSPLVVNCAFVANVAGGGAGMMNLAQSSPTLVNCTFRSNLGHAVSNASCTKVTMRDCTFADHHGTSAGGAMINTRTNIELSGCLFCGNSARTGAALFVGDTHLVATNCTFADNHAELEGAAIYTHRNVTGEIRNCIFWDNTASRSPQMTVYKASTVTVSYCNIEGGRSMIEVLLPEDTTLIWGPGNMAVDPHYAAPGYWDANGTPDNPEDDFWVDGDYHLRSQAGRWDPVSENWVTDEATSPCIDAGDPDSPIGEELFPNGRRINMGAYGGTAEGSRAPVTGPTPGQWSEPVPLVEVNLDTAEEWSPTLSADGLTLYFSRVRGPDSYYGRIFQATRPRPFSHFRSIIEVPGSLNESDGHVHSQWVCPDGQRIYYTYQPDGVFRLKVSERASTSDWWPVGWDLPRLNLLGARLHTPRLTPDELTILFAASDIGGEIGGYDLWMATRPDRKAPFGDPVNLIRVNTTFNDIHAFVSADGLALYFASDRNGRYQLFMATREDPDGPFGEPVLLTLLDAPGGDDRFPCLAADGRTFYFVRETGGDRSTRDIWVSYRIE